MPVAHVVAVAWLGGLGGDAAGAVADGAGRLGSGPAARPDGDGSALVLADLNVPAALVRPLAGRWRLLARVPTYPAAAPRIQFDHVLGRGPLPPVAAVASPQVGVGDHRPVVVTL